MAFWQCYYHVVWTTKYRAPLITADLESILWDAVQRKSLELACPILAVNGTADHIHVAVCVPPKLSVAEWVGQIKGYSSHQVNTLLPNIDTRFRWQKHYGVLTFGATNLKFVKGYIASQKEHHHQNATIAYLERTDGDE